MPRDEEKLPRALIRSMIAALTLPDHGRARLLWDGNCPERDWENVLGAEWAAPRL